VLARTATICGLLLLASPAWPQTPLAGKVTGGFKFPALDEQNRLRSLVTGQEMQPLAGGLVAIKQLRLETYRESGDLDLIAEAPESTFDVGRRVLSSPGPLKAWSADERLSITGVGFEYEQYAGRFVLSNDVHTILRRGPTHPPAAGVESPLEIFARRFAFEQTNKLAVYRDAVRVNDPQMDLTCGVLNVRLGAESGSFEQIEAQQDVVVLGKEGHSRATGDRAVYERANERVELTGGATWQQGPRAGTADVLTYHRTARSVQADGQVRMTLPRETFGQTGFPFFPARSLDAGGTNPGAVVRIAADHFQTLSNLTLFRGGVRAGDETNRLRCGLLAVHSATAESPEDIVIAEEDVRVEQGSNWITAARAVYTRSTDTAVFTGRPEWRTDRSEGRGETLMVQPGSDRFQARQNAYVRLLASGGPGGGSLLPVLASGTNVTATEASPVEITADDFELKGREAGFTGRVRARELPGDGSQSRMQCGRLAVGFAGGGGAVERVVAREAVVIESGTPGVTNGPAKYQKLAAEAVTAQFDPATGEVDRLLAEGRVEMVQPGVLASGDRAEYTRATDQLVLTGRPTGETPEVVFTEAQAFVWNRAKNTLQATPPYKMKVKVKPPGSDGPAGASRPGAGVGAR
jgi:lipopolysaccharide export system protein LptA